MKAIIFDTETTGLPKNWKAPMRDLNNWPRVISLAWVACEDGKPFNQGHYLIYPDGWQIPTEKFWIDNGFSQEKSKIHGTSISKVLGYFLENHNQCDVLVSHNMSFDYNVLGAELLRAGLRSEKSLKKICTKEHGTDLCQLPGNYGFKWPKLVELHQFLFNEAFEGAHDALADVKACMKCFYEMVNRGTIILS